MTCYRVTFERNRIRFEVLIAASAGPEARRDATRGALACLAAHLVRAGGGRPSEWRHVSTAPDEEYLLDARLRVAHDPPAS